MTGVLVVAAVLLRVAMIQVGRLRQDYGTCVLWPEAHTPRLLFHGRRYLQSTGGRPAPAGTVVLGTAPGDEILGLPPIADYAPTVLYVRYPDGTVTGEFVKGSIACPAAS